MRQVMSLVSPVCAAAFLASPIAPAQNVQDVLDRTRSMYVSLRTYADTGVVINEYGTSSQDQHTFKTYFSRNPRHFLLDVHKQGGDRYVVWGEPNAFHTWWKTTGQQFDYPNPNNVNAISGSGQNTKDAALKIPTLLYGKSALAGALLSIAEPALGGTEDLGGRKCYRLTGRASDQYAASGHEINVRKTAFWIDVESLLIRRVLEEWPALPGQRSRTITNYQPQANPMLEDATFKFVAPGRS